MAGEARKTRRPVLLLAFFIVACVSSAIALVYSTHKSRSLFVELEQLTTERDELDIEWGQLQIEQSTWATHARIERVALDELALAVARHAEFGAGAVDTGFVEREHDAVSRDHAVGAEYGGLVSLSRSERPTFLPFADELFRFGRN